MAHHHPGAGGKGVMNRYALVELPERAIFVQSIKFPQLTYQKKVVTFYV